MANDSFPMNGMLRLEDLRALRQVCSRIEVHFDCSHRATQKPPHFDIDLSIDLRGLQRLCTQSTQQTFYAFQFGTQPVYQRVASTNGAVRLRYEAYAYDQQRLFQAMGQSTRDACFASLVMVASGGVGAMHKNVIRP